MAVSNELTYPIPAVSVDRVPDLLRHHFGLSGELKALTSERDLNFRLRDGAGQAYVVKFTNAAEPLPVTRFQTAFMQRVSERDPSVPVPGVIQTQDGASDVLVEAGADQVLMRVLTFLDGVPQHAVDSSEKQLASLGQILARVDLAVADLEHEGGRRELLWDICRLPNIRDRIHHIIDTETRSMVERFVQRFHDHVVPVLPTLRQQAIHNDANPHNVVVSSDDLTVVSGLIDFGDALKGPLVNDLATAMAYHVTAGDETFSAALALARGYTEIVPLTAEEIELLPDLAAARMALGVAVASWRAEEHPENRPYILRNMERARAGLAMMSGPGGAALVRLLRQACLS